MFELKPIFFPDPGYTLIAALCYGLIFLTAYKRFDTLIINYGAYDAPETARPWTTWLRYHAAAAIYACLYAVAFALLYQLLHRHPVLIEAAIDWVGRDNPAGQTLTKLGHDIKLFIPVLALVLLTIGAEKARRTSAIDRKLRYYFQQLGSIPRAISMTIRQMKKVEIDGLADVCIDAMSPEMRNEILHPVVQDNPKSLEHLYLRACHLFHQIRAWNSMDSDFYPFRSAYPQAFENIKTRFKKVDHNANRYYQWKLSFAENADLHASKSGREGPSRFETAYPKILTELRKDLKEELKDILENIYIFIACAIHNKGITAKKRHQLLQSFGFAVDDKKPEDQKGVDPNDMTILAIFLVFVIPLAAVFARLAGDDNLSAVHTITYVVWTAMALFVGLASVVIPAMVKRRMAQSNGAFWRSIRPNRGRPWCAYLVSGLLAGSAGSVGILLLHVLNPQQGGYPPAETIARVLPWGLVPMAIAFSLGYHLDRKTIDGKRTSALETATTALSAMVAAVCAVLINAGTVDLVDLIPRTYFSLTAAVLLGGCIGAVVPYRYRRQMAAGNRIVETEVDLKHLLQRCIARLAERASSGDIVLHSQTGTLIPIVRADAEKIAMAINGLLFNALEFTPREGQITVSLDWDSSRGCTISVEDNGIGMSAAKIASIMEAPKEALAFAWERVGDTAFADLVQVRAIARRHGGDLTLTSQRWHGTHVMLRLPADRAYPAPATRRVIQAVQDTAAAQPA